MTTFIRSDARPTVVARAVQLALFGFTSTAFSSQALAETEGAQQDNTLPTVVVVGKSAAPYVVKNSSTATKTDTLLRDTPQSITVIPQQLIRDQGMQNMADAIRYIPGIVTAQGEGNRDTAVFRGSNSTGDFFIDGMRDDVQYYRDFYNIASIEALKGSNAMIFGRGGSGGVINRVSKQPQWNAVREASLTLGSWDNRRLTADVGQALGKNVAFRINGLYEDSGSYRDGVSLERAGINPTLAIRAGGNTLLVLGYEHFRDDRVADRGVPSFNGKPFATDSSTFFGSAENSPVWARVNAWTATIDHDFGGGVSVRNRTRYADYDKFYQNVYAGGEVGADGMVKISAYNNATQRTNLFNQTDLLFSLNTGAIKHKMATGLELGRQVTDNFRNTGYFPGNGGEEFINVPTSNPQTNDPVEFRQKLRDANNHGTATMASIYVQDQIDISPQWQAIAGIRYDRFSVDFLNRRDGSAIETTDTPLSPRLGLVYKPVTDVSVYGSYSLAFVPRAGDQLGSLTAANSVFDPEEFRNLELGVKWDIRPDLASTVAIYQLDRDNVATTDPANAAQSILVDGQRTRGLELGLSGSVSKNWSVMGAYAFQDAEHVEAQTNIPAGNKVAQVPKHTFSLWNRYDLSSTWGGGLGLIYRDSIFASNDNKVEVPSYTRVDAALFYTMSKQLQAQLNVENLFDTEYYASAHNNNNITPGSPRAFRVTLSTKF